MKKIIILLLFLITSCGYQPLYQIDGDKNNFKFQEIEFIGDKNLSKKIFLNLPIEINKTNKLLKKIILYSNKEIIEASKNSKGQVNIYRTSISIKLSIIDDDNNIVKEKTLTKDFSYNVKENKFKFKEFQNEVENNLIKKIIEDLIIYLNLK